MTKKALALTFMAAIIASLSTAAGSFAQTFGPDTVTIRTEGYKNTRGIVTFHHSKHVQDYKLSCGNCHHDDNGTPLSSFKMGNKASGCVKCHDLDSLHKSHTPEVDINCGECHVDKDGNPLEVLEIQKCIDCHDKPGRTPVGAKYPKLPKEERLEYHGDAMHYLCIGCHREFNKKNDGSPAPIACNKCHPKAEKK